MEDLYGITGAWININQYNGRFTWEAYFPDKEERRYSAGIIGESLNVNTLRWLSERIPQDMKGEEVKVMSFIPREFSADEMGTPLKGVVVRVALRFLEMNRRDISFVFQPVE